MLAWRSVPVYSLIIGALISWRGLRSRSLSPSGGVAAFIIGSVMLSTELHVFGVTLLVFYFIGSRATRVGKVIKAKLEDSADGGYRTAFQVLCNSLPALIASVLWRGLFTDSWVSNFLPIQLRKAATPFDFTNTCATSPQFGDGWSRFLLLVTLGQFGCCLGDTLASELGILSKSRPILITTLKTVPPGTNGGVSLLGTAVSIIGGGVMGLTIAVDLLIENSACRSESFGWILSLLGLGLLSGGLGSLLDSLLGATLQETRLSKSSNKILTDESKRDSKTPTSIISGINILTNNQVNLISSIATALLIAFVGQ